MDSGGDGAEAADVDEIQRPQVEDDGAVAFVGQQAERLSEMSCGG